MESIPIVSYFFDYQIPLALGWPVAIWLIWVNMRLSKRLMELVESNTAAMTHLADNIKFLQTLRDRDG